ncbi:sugar (and other) transporter family protein [Lysobacter capsici]|uniref:MFS transporter n=1 Tax=Lysobacter capsici TaxID=435897 RepID=UPI00071657FF|nr:MFS transporter [Lysobacter capsici]ALN85278.1 sugar (and other) transporter family protein [Lysobacter capsici]
MSPAPSDRSGFDQSSTEKAGVDQAGFNQANPHQPNPDRSTVTQLAANSGGSKRVLAGLMLALFLGAIEQTVVATALPAIVGDLQRFDLMGWAVSAYLLASAAATPVIGKLGDLHGRRIMLLVCMGGFLLGSVLCALASSMPMLVAARALQGVGGAGLIIVAQAAVAEIAGPRDRSRFAGYFAIVWAVAGLIGPLLGGALTDWLGWRAIFWINLPIGLLALAIAWPGLRAFVAAGHSGRIDYLSTLLFAIATTAFLFALTWGGVRYAWTSSQVLGLFAFAAVVGFAFALRQTRVADPVLPPMFLRHAVIGPALLVGLLTYGFYIAVAVLMPAYYQIGLGLSASHAGMSLIPALVGGAISALLGGRHAARSGDFKGPVLLGFPIAIAALFAMGLFAERLTALSASLLLGAVGFGIGPSTAIINVVAQNAAPTRQLGSVTGAMAFVRTLGTAVVATAGSALILLRLAQAGIGTAHDGASARSLSELAAQALSPSARELFRAAFGGLFYAAAAGLLLAAIVFMSIRSRHLRVSTEPELAAAAEA